MTTFPVASGSSFPPGRSGKNQGPNPSVPRSRPWFTCLSESGPTPKKLSRGREDFGVRKWNGPRQREGTSGDGSRGHAGDHRYRTNFKGSRRNTYLEEEGGGRRGPRGR